MHLVVIEHIVGGSSILYYGGPGDQSKIMKLDNKGIYLMNHLTKPHLLISEYNLFTTKVTTDTEE